MLLPNITTVACLGVLLAASVDAVSQTDAGSTPTPEFWQWASTPPMGWNSYDAFGGSVCEEEVRANAAFMKGRLLAHGWKYVVIDFRWYDSISSYDDRQLNKERAGAK